MLIVSLIVLFVFGIFASSSYAIWQALLDEDFNKDQQNPNLRWPWITHRLNHPRMILRWHHNPLNWITAEGNLSPASWGIQDYIFNAHITPNDDIQQSIWCCYCDFNGPNNPRWPPDDDYINNMNAWTWWGPMNTEEWAGGAVSFWFLNDLPRYARDSLSVLLCETDYITSRGRTFRENCAFGKTYARSSQPNWDWEFSWFYFDSVYVDGELSSMLGMEDDIWLAFVFQSDARDIAGKGAFIDDVIISWDDGLFEIYPVRTMIGYIVNEDSTYWTTNMPREDDEILFRLDWGVDGFDETPPFAIHCYLDSTLIYTDTVTAVAGLDTVYTTIADTLWRVTAHQGEEHHLVHWELDPPLDEGGQVEETNEDNNAADFDIYVEWNPPPMFAILTPEEDSTEITGRPFPIHWTVTDSNEFDEVFRIILYFSDDTTGLAANPDTVFEYNWIYSFMRASRGEGSYDWNYRSALEEGALDTGMVFWIVGFASDGYQNNRTVAVSPGRLYVPPTGVGGFPGVQPPAGFGLTRAFPNPFNRGLRVEYSLASPSVVKLQVFDIAGRRVADIETGPRAAGVHSAAWRPGDIPAGVYSLRLEAGGDVALRKVVYMP